jgi:DNA modification methylase
MDFVNQVFAMDGLALLQALPDDSVDLVLTDPPYFVRQHGSLDKTYFGNWLTELKRVLKDNAYFAINLDVATAQVVLPILAKKASLISATQWEYAGPTKIKDDILYVGQLHRSATTTSPTPNTVIQQGNVDFDTRCNAILSTIVQTYTNPGDMVCDPFLGGGNAVVVAKQLGRNYVGSDIVSEIADSVRNKL